MNSPSSSSSGGNKEPCLTLRDMVKGAETTARAVRFYEMQKLIRPAKRSPGGHRLFTHSELDKLRLVLDLRTCGLSIEEIREVLQAKSRGATVREAALTVQGLLFRHVKELQRKIAVIERLHREFDVSQQVLDRCVHCTDPRGPAACPTCEVPKLALAPPSFHQIWAIPSPSKNRPEPDGQVG